MPNQSIESALAAYRQKLEQDERDQEAAEEARVRALKESATEVLSKVQNSLLGEWFGDLTKWSLIRYDEYDDSRMRRGRTVVAEASRSPLRFLVTWRPSVMNPSVTRFDIQPMWKNGEQIGPVITELWQVGDFVQKMTAEKAQGS